MIRKSFVLIAGIAITSAAIAQQKPFSISGNIQGRNDGYIYLAYSDGDDKYRTDSAQIKDGSFSFNGNLSGPTSANVMIDKDGRSYKKYAQLYIMPGKMQLSIPYNEFDEAILKGSSVQAEADELKKSKAGITAKLKPYREAYDKANMAYIDAKKAGKDEATQQALKDKATEAKDAMDPYFAEMNKIDAAFMDKHPSSYVTASMMRYSVSRMTHKEAEERYNKFAPEVKKSGLGKSIKTEIDALRDGSPGAKAFMFASTELRGGELKLADLKGKYVLVDFWASWCVPCRKGNPHLLSLYAKYKEKGLEIVGVSDDDSNPDAWKKAVEQDKIGVWKHVLRGLKRVDGPAMFDRSTSISDRYGIHSLPTKVLIDPNGVIIGRYGGGGENDAAMDKKLAEIFEKG